MSCGCWKKTKERREYDNTKRIAIAFAKSENVTVALYQTKEGSWNFVEFECPQYYEINPIEFIYPLQ